MLTSFFGGDPKTQAVGLGRAPDLARQPRAILPVIRAVEKIALVRLPDREPVHKVLVGQNVAGPARRGARWSYP